MVEFPLFSLALSIFYSLRAHKLENNQSAETQWINGHRIITEPFKLIKSFVSCH